MIYLVRHGRTALNAEGRFRGRQDAPLDDVGREEAVAAAGALASLGLRAVYTSPLSRARETASAIANRCGTDVTVMPDLTDLDYGEWQDLIEAEARTGHPHEFEIFRTEPLLAAAPGGESLAALERRVLRCLEQIATRHPADPVAAVTHEVSLRVLVAAAKDSVERFWDEHIPTGAILALTIASEVNPTLRAADVTLYRRVSCA
jgi:broad specificity phosphatase PhoE